jgi:hypothetical protein
LDSIGAKGVSIRAINEWAAATLPVVQAHLDAARVLKVALDKARSTTH